MPRIRVVCAGLVMAITLALTGAHAQTAPSKSVGRPLALLAGLRPPHEAKRAVHGKATHPASRKTATRKPHRLRAAAKHGRYVARKKIARQRHEASESAITASAFAEEPPPQAAPADVAPGVVTAPPVSQPVLENAQASVGASPDPTAVKVQTLRIAAPNQGSGVAPVAQQNVPPVASSSDSTAAPPPPAPQSVLAAPIHHNTIGSASWIAQVLAAFGGAVTAGAVAWFLIGGGPVRTYG